MGEPVLGEAIIASQEPAVAWLGAPVGAGWWATLWRRRRRWCPAARHRGYSASWPPDRRHASLFPAW